MGECCFLRLHPASIFAVLHFLVSCRWWGVNRLQGSCVTQFVLSHLYVSNVKLIQHSSGQKCTNILLYMAGTVLQGMHHRNRYFEATTQRIAQTYRDLHWLQPLIRFITDLLSLMPTHTHTNTNTQTHNRQCMFLNLSGGRAPYLSRIPLSCTAMNILTLTLCIYT